MGFCATRTVQFRIKDFVFFKDGTILYKSSSLEEFLEADSATMKISNQNNGRMGQTVHHESFDHGWSYVQ